jgi:putative sigma-54 modulation protein
MKMDLQTVGFTAEEALLDYTREKTEGLAKYYDQIVGAEVYLKLTNNDHKQTKVAEIKLNIPGNDLFASDQSDKFEGAINAAVEKLKGQIRKLKTKMNPY